MSGGTPAPAVSSEVTAGPWDLRVRVEGEGPPVVLLHGLLTDARAWDEVVARLRDRYRLILVDAPGHGGSPARPGPYTLEEEADVVATTLAGLGLTGPMVWAGHSMGGMKALRVALRHPELVSALVLVSTQPYEEPERTARPYYAMVEAARTWGIDADLAEVIGRLNFHPGFLTTPRGRGWLEHFTTLCGADIEQACDAVFGRGDISGRLAEIDVPALVLHGASDIPIRIGVTRAWAPLLPQARLVEVAHCGHTPQCEQPALVAELLDSFCRQASGTASVR
ncbi:alpha/beta fold hydrolase [Streptomyces sp. NPDC094032]|uniref:alpha/beta fold hydrolase n=1 Tax=Streptomyces sp. NPDC094032 TaxID=3155308 RepID=UPI003324D747